MDRPDKTRKRRLRTERETDDDEFSHRSATIIETSGSADQENLVSGPVPDFLPESEQKTALAEPGVTQRDLNIQRAMDGTGTSQEEVPDQVLEVIGDGGLPLDPTIQRSLEERMDADFSDVRIHTGPKAAKAADAIDARAFTCGNSIVFNDGEYEPESPEGQFLLAHELAHVKQQNGGAPLSMMPKPDADLEIDPDPQLEREADRAAQEALQGEEPLTVNRLGADVHIQRMPAEIVPQALDMFKRENEGGGAGSFQQSQNEDRIEFIEDEIKWAIENVDTHAEALDEQEELILDARAEGDKERVARLKGGKESIENRISELFSHIQDKAEQIALTDDQREKLYGSNDFDGGEALAELGWTTVKSLISLVPGMGQVIAVYEIGETALRQFWEQTDGSLTDRLAQVKEQIVSQSETGTDNEKVNF